MKVEGLNTNEIFVDFIPFCYYIFPHVSTMRFHVFSSVVLTCLRFHWVVIIVLIYELLRKINTIERCGSQLENYYGYLAYFNSQFPANIVFDIEPLFRLSRNSYEYLKTNNVPARYRRRSNVTKSNLL